MQSIFKKIKLDTIQYSFINNKFLKYNLDITYIVPTVNE